MFIYLAAVPIGQLVLNQILNGPHLLEFIIAFLAEYFFTNVFGCDLLVFMIIRAHQGATAHVHKWHDVEPYPENNTEAFARHEAVLSNMASIMGPLKSGN
jgi:hypothetical protein